MPFYRDGDDLVIVGSNGGSDRDPLWWKNLQAHPRAEVEVGAEHLTVTAALASPEHRARLWLLLKAWNPNYGRYESRTEREIPVVVLTASR